MSRLIFTGDIHGSLEAKKLSFKNFPLGRELTREDYVIICGDFGCIWDGSRTDKYWLDWIEDKPFTTLFVDGNHENFPLINSYPVEKWNGGNTHVIRPHIKHLMRGEIFTIAEKTFFCLGGATSLDKIYRVEGKSWWPEEIPSFQEFNNAAENLTNYNFKVDYIVTHCAPNSIIDSVDRFSPKHDDVTNFLEKFVVSQVTFKKWFMGHYHIDRTVKENYFLLYNDFVEILPNNEIKMVND